jgi:hypothetical protein
VPGNSVNETPLGLYNRSVTRIKLVKGRSMAKLRPILTFTFLIVSLSGFSAIPYAAAEEGSCYLKANATDVFVIVYDLDDNGIQGKQIWQGRINQGESAKITTPHGRFRYDYNAKPDIDQPLSGGSDRSCSNLETIMVP